MTVEPGESSPVHHHTRDWLYVYVTDDNTLESRYLDGRRARAHFGDGYVGYHVVGDPSHPDLTHALHNMGERTHRQVLIEFKVNDNASDGGPLRSDNGRRANV
jgi:hypothetical protein